MDADQKVGDFLSHHGVKGMKWGVRRAQKRLDKADREWEKKVLDKGGLSLNAHEYVALHNAAADKTNRLDVNRINNKPEYKGKDLNKPGALQDKYYAEHESAFNKRFREAMMDTYGTSPSGGKKIQIKGGEVSIVEVKHALDTTKITLKLSDDGHILAFEVVDDSLEQSMSVDTFLSHHGIKGMKWGVRRKRGPSGRVSTERKRVDQIQDKVKVHGKKALTNKDLADYNKRLELETKFDKLKSGEMSGAQKAVAAGAAFVGGMALNIGKQHIQRGAQKMVKDTLAGSAARRASRAAANRAAKTAARHTPVRPLMLNP